MENNIDSSPPPSPHALTFNAKLTALTSYTPYDLLYITRRRPSLVALFSGARAASSSAAVVRAFTVLYEDMPPLRMSGNMIFSYLTRLAEESRGEADAEREALAGRLGRPVSESDFCASKSIFHDIDENNDSSLCADELSKRGSGILAAFGADEDVDRFLRTYGTKDREALQSIEFDEFMVALMEAIEKSDADVTIESLLLLHRSSLPATSSPTPPPPPTPPCTKSERFDAMLQQVRTWESLGLTAPGRRGEILLGTYAGAKNAEVVRALKACYCDYGALRLAGDLIFKLLKGAMARKAKRNQVT